MHPCILEMGGNESTHHITRTKPMLEILLFGLCTWETYITHEAHLTTPVAGGRDEQGDDAPDGERLWRAHTHTGSIKIVGLWKLVRGAVELGESPAAALNGETERLQLIIQRKPRAIDRCRIFERYFCLCEKTLELLWLLLEKDRDILGALREIALLTCERQIACPVCASLHTRHDMVYLKGNIVFAAIGAGARPLLQQIFSEFVPCSCSLLVCTPFDLWILHCLGIEANELHADRLNGAHTSEALHPGHDMAYAARKRRSKPALAASAVLEARLTVSRVSPPT